MTEYFSKRLANLLLTLLLFYTVSCSSSLNSEKDLSTLNPNYFIQDSVTSTPLKISINWHPKENDFVKIEIKVGICSDIKYESDWQNNSSITIELDTRIEQQLIVNLLFDLSSYYPYDIQYGVSIDGNYLLNERMELYKLSESKYTFHGFNCFLPLFKSSGLLDFGSPLYMCPDYPVTFIRFLPDCYDSISTKSIGLKDRFTLNIKSNKNDVIFYDKLLREGKGKTIEVSVNEFDKYQILLNEKKENVVDDTIKVTYNNSDFCYEFRYIVLKNSPTLKKIKDLYVRYNKEIAFPGDTLIVILSFRNVNGEEEYFDDDTEFQAVINDGCEVSDLLSSEGEVSKYFPAIKQPIKLVIYDYPKNGNVKVKVGLYPGYKYDANLKY